MSDEEQPRRIDVTIDHHGRPVRVREVAGGWRVEHAGAVVEHRHLDGALAKAFGIPPGSTFDLVR